MNNNGEFHSKKDGCLLWGIIIVSFVLGIVFTVIGVVNVSSSSGDMGWRDKILPFVGAGCAFLLPVVWVVLTIRDYVRRKKGVDIPAKIVWDCGVITDKVIREHIRKGKNTYGWTLLGLGLFMAFMALWGTFIPVTPIYEKEKLLFIVYLIFTAVTIIKGIKELLLQFKRVEYRVEEDRVIEIGKIGQGRSGKLVISFEKNGEYPIDSVHYNVSSPFEVIASVQAGEEVYMIYERGTHKLLHVYRKKYWSRA